MVDRELTEREAETTVKAIKDGLNAVLESSTEFCAPFIGSLHVSTYMYLHKCWFQVFDVCRTHVTVLLFVLISFSEQDVCFHEKQLVLQPTAVSAACLLCMQEPVGKQHAT